MMEAGPYQNPMAGWIHRMGYFRTWMVRYVGRQRGGKEAVFELP
jgi:hypothetical protein